MTPAIPHAVQIAVCDTGISFTVIDRVARALARESLVESTAGGWISTPGVSFETLTARAAELEAAPTHHDCPECGLRHLVAGG